MTDALSHRLERTIIEMTSGRHDVDPPDLDTYKSLMASIDRDRARIPRIDAIRLEDLASRRTGVKR